MAYWSSVNYNKTSFIDYNGIKQYDEGSIKHPITAEASGILNFLLTIGNLAGSIIPFCKETCGTVGDMNG